MLLMAIKMATWLLPTWLFLIKHRCSVVHSGHSAEINWVYTHTQRKLNEWWLENCEVNDGHVVSAACKSAKSRGCWSNVLHSWKANGLYLISLASLLAFSGLGLRLYINLTLYLWDRNSGLESWWYSLFPMLNTLLSIGFFDVIILPVMLVISSKH